MQSSAGSVGLRLRRACPQAFAGYLSSAKKTAERRDRWADRTAIGSFMAPDRHEHDPHPAAASSTIIDMVDEASYVCDSCGEEIIIPVDRSGGSVQRYVEDCPVCCRANVIHVEIDADEHVRVRAETE